MDQQLAVMHVLTNNYRSCVYQQLSAMSVWTNNHLSCLCAPTIICHACVDQQLSVMHVWTNNYFSWLSESTIIFHISEDQQLSDKFVRTNSYLSCLCGPKMTSLGCLNQQLSFCLCGQTIICLGCLNQQLTVMHVCISKNFFMHVRISNCLSCMCGSAITFMHVWISHCLVLASFYWLKPLTDDGGEETGVLGKSLTMSFRKCLTLKPGNFSSN